MAYKLKSIFRYPVKSMSGQGMTTAQLYKGGIVGDRNWAVYNLEKNEIQGARNLPKLLQLKATYTEEPTLEQPGRIRIEFPDGQNLETNKSIASPVLDDFLGVAVKLCPLEPASNIRHYSRGGMIDESELRKQMAIEPGDKLPDLSSLPVTALATTAVFATPPGYYYDLYPLHLLTTGALQHLTNLTGNTNFIAERFRPNLLIENQDSTQVEEFTWTGLQAKIGDSGIKINAETVRCSIPSRSQLAGIAQDKKVSQAVAKHCHRHLGVYSTVTQPGQIQVGDTMVVNRSLGGLLQQQVDSVTRDIKKGILDLFR